MREEGEVDVNKRGKGRNLRKVRKKELEKKRKTFHKSKTNKCKVQTL